MLYRLFYIFQSERIPEDRKLRNIFMEILRLWPPFLGAYRVTNTDVEVGDFHVPKGYVSDRHKRNVWN